MSYLNQLEELRQKVAAARHEARQLEAERQAAPDEVQRVSQLLTSAFAEGDEKAIKALTKDKAAAAAHAAEPWHERVAGAELRIGAAQADVDRFVQEHHGVLTTELRPSAEAARDGLVEWLEAFDGLLSQWHAVARQHEQLLPPLGRSPREVPSFDSANAIRSAVRDFRQSGVPLPATPDAPTKPHRGWPGLRAA